MMLRGLPIRLTRRSCNRTFTDPRHLHGSSFERRASEGLPKTPARTRFAPSPTGDLHIGSLRTALFNYLLAKATGGQFILRIEDTDRKRLIPDAEKRLLEDLSWTGLKWDEGPDVGGPYGSYRQSERTKLYHEYAQVLLEKDKAYRCFCSTDRLNALAQERHTIGYATAYDRHCLALSHDEAAERVSKGQPNVVRLKMSSQIPSFIDLIYGLVQDKRSIKKVDKHIADTTYEDPILLKSDSMPTYHLANVVDDHHMKISHVVRAAEWMSSTPKHIAIYDALGWTPPQFAHVGLLQDLEGQKLSKRAGKIEFSVRAFADAGILPEALINYLALLGWSHRTESDFLSLSELIKAFDLKFTKGNTKFDHKKLTYLQKCHAQSMVYKAGLEFEDMVNKVTAQAVKDAKEKPNARLIQVQDIRSLVQELLKKDSQFYTTTREFLDRYEALFLDPQCPPWSSKDDDLSVTQTRALHDLIQDIETSSWTTSTIQTSLNDWAQQTNTSSKSADATMSPKSIHGTCLRYLRWALTGGRPGPTVTEMMVMLGRDTTLERMSCAQRRYNQTVQAAQ